MQSTFKKKSVISKNKRKLNEDRIIPRVAIEVLMETAAPFEWGRENRFLDKNVDTR